MFRLVRFLTLNVFYWSQGWTRRRSEQLRRQREDALLVERLDKSAVARRPPGAAPAGRGSDRRLGAGRRAAEAQVLMRRRASGSDPRQSSGAPPRRGVRMAA